MRDEHAEAPPRVSPAEGAGGEALDCLSFGSPTLRLGATELLGHCLRPGALELVLGQHAGFLQTLELGDVVVR